MQNPEVTPDLAQKPAPKGLRRLLPRVLAAILGVVLLAAVAGFLSGRQLSVANESLMNQARVTEQFGLSMQDMQKGQFGVAATRLAYIQAVQPDFPGLQSKIDEANRGINATPTPIPTSTPQPSPTPDVSRGDQLILKAQEQFKKADYRGMYITLIGLKVEIPAFKPVRVDGLIWTALRYEGVTLINNGSLTEGAFYLDLAKNYSPLDAKAADRLIWSETVLLDYQQAYVDLARQDYENAVASFEAILNIAPGYRANLQADYIDLLKTYGSSLLKSGENVCKAQELFDKALAFLPDDADLTQLRDNANNQCHPPVTPTETPSLTPTP
jgi:tetratricopeptide (TPR) repeat protein